MSDPGKQGPAPPAEQPPPILGTWRRVYAAVLIMLVVLIVLFYLFGRAFR